MSLPSPCCSAPLSIPCCPSLLLLFFLGASGHRILFVVLDGKGFFLPPICFHTCLLVCSQLVSLFFYLHCDSSLRVLLVKGISSSPVPLSPLLSVLRSGGFGDRTQVSSVFVLVSLLHSHMWLFSLGASGGTICSLSSVCLRAYPPCSLQLVPLLLSFSLSLSLAVLLSRCLFGHMILFVSHLFAYLSPLFSPSCILNCLPLAILLISSLRLLSVLVS